MESEGGSSLQDRIQEFVRHLEYTTDNMDRLVSAWQEHRETFTRINREIADCQNEKYVSAGNLMRASSCG